MFTLQRGIGFGHAWKDIEPKPTLEEAEKLRSDYEFHQQDFAYRIVDENGVVVSESSD